MIANCPPRQDPVEITFGQIIIHRLEQRVDGEIELLFVAFLHGKFVGSITARMQPWKACSLKMLFIAPRARRLGVATRLLAEAEKWATNQNAEQIECGVLKGNSPARQFWIRKGRFIDDTTREAGGDRSNEYVVMYRTLQ